MAIGSIKASYYISEMKEKIKANKFDICYISGFSAPRRKQKNHPDWSKYQETFDILTEYMERFLRETEYSCCIPLRVTFKYGPEKTEELEYFEKYKIDKVADIFKNDLEEMTTYHLMYNSKVSVAGITASLFEGFGWGKKILYCNFVGINNFKFPLKRFYALEEKGYSKFKKTLINLIEMNQQEYYELTKEDRKQIMNYNKKYPSHSVVRDFVLEHISQLT